MMITLALIFAMSGIANAQQYSFELEIQPVVNKAGEPVLQDSVVHTVHIGEYRAAYVEALSDETVSIVVGVLKYDLGDSFSTIGVFDGKVNFGDFFLFVDQFGQSGKGLYADFNGDDVVDFEDFFAFADGFGSSFSAAKRASYASVHALEQEILEKVSNASAFKQEHPSAWKRAIEIMARYVVMSEMRTETFSSEGVFYNALGQTLRNVRPEQLASGVYFYKHSPSAQSVRLVNVSGRVFVNNTTRRAAKTAQFVQFTHTIVSVNNTFEPITQTVTGTPGIRVPTTPRVNILVQGIAGGEVTVAVPQGVATVLDNASLFTNDDPEGTRYEVIGDIPSGISLDGRFLTVVSTASINSVFRVVIRATDDTGTSVEGTFVITTEKAPDITGPAGDLQINGTSYTGIITEEESYPLEIRVTVGAETTTQIIENGSFELVGDLSGYPVGDHEVVIVAVDAAGNETWLSGVITVTTPPDTTPPTLSVEKAEGGSAVLISMQDASLVRILVEVDGVVSADTLVRSTDALRLPTGLVYRKNNIAFHSVTVTATDSLNNSVSESLRYLIDDVTPPTTIILKQEAWFIDGNGNLNIAGVAMIESGSGQARGDALRITANGITREFGFAPTDRADSLIYNGSDNFGANETSSTRNTIIEVSTKDAAGNVSETKMLTLRQEPKPITTSSGGGDSGSSSGGDSGSGSSGGDSGSSGGTTTTPTVTAPSISSASCNNVAPGGTIFAGFGTSISCTSSASGTSPTYSWNLGGNTGSGSSASVSAKNGSLTLTVSNSAGSDSRSWNVVSFGAP